MSARAPLEGAAPRRTRRRGLLGFAGLVAALGFGRSASEVQAANGQPMQLGLGNFATSRTQINGVVPGASIRFDSIQHEGVAVAAAGSAGGPGVVALAGANKASGDGGNGMYVKGGLTETGTGGTGGRFAGGTSKSATGGFGAEVFGFGSNAQSSGNGVRAIGGDALTTPALPVGEGGHGAEAVGGTARFGPGCTGVVAQGGSAAGGGTAGSGVLAVGSASDDEFQGRPGAVVVGGLQAQSDSATEPALRGDHLGKRIGVLGSAANGFSAGVRGLGTTGAGGYFESLKASGIFASSVSGVGAQGTSTSGPGISAVSSQEPGARASSDDNVAAYGASTNNVGGFIVAESKDQYAVLANNPAATAADLNQLGVLVNGDWAIQNGVKSAAVPTSRGLTLLYAVEGPVALFEDVGTARLAAGRARVDLDPLFVETIDASDYFVFVSPRGETRGLFVASQDARGFEIREQGGGTSSLDVAYRVVARRKGIPPERRLATVPTHARPTPYARKVTGRPLGLPRPLLQIAPISPRPEETPDPMRLARGGRS